MSAKRFIFHGFNDRRGRKEQFVILFVSEAAKREKRESEKEKEVEEAKKEKC